MAQNANFVNALEEEGDVYEKIAHGYLEQFPPPIPRAFRCGTSPLEVYDDGVLAVRFHVTKPAAIRV